MFQNTSFLKRILFYMIKFITLTLIFRLQSVSSIKGLPAYRRRLRSRKPEILYLEQRQLERKEKCEDGKGKKSCIPTLSPTFLTKPPLSAESPGTSAPTSILTNEDLQTTAPTAKPVDPIQGQCSNGNKFVEFRVKYETRACDESNNGQKDGGVFKCLEYSARSSNIAQDYVSIDCMAPIAPEVSVQIFSDIVQVGESFVIRDIVENDIFISDRLVCYISVVQAGKDEELYQVVTFDTSGEQNLFIGDTFGSLSVISCTTELPLSFSPNTPTILSLSSIPTNSPISSPTLQEENTLTGSPTQLPTSEQTLSPTQSPTNLLTFNPTYFPTGFPTFDLKPKSSQTPSHEPTSNPTSVPTELPTTQPVTFSPTVAPVTDSPTTAPATNSPTPVPTSNGPTPPPKTAAPTTSPTFVPSITPSATASSDPTPTLPATLTIEPSPDSSLSKTIIPSRSPPKMLISTAPTQSLPFQNPTAVPKKETFVTLSHNDGFRSSCLDSIAYDDSNIPNNTTLSFRYKAWLKPGSQDFQKAIDDITKAFHFAAAPLILSCALGQRRNGQRILQTQGLGIISLSSSTISVDKCSTGESLCREVESEFTVVSKKLVPKEVIIDTLSPILSKLMNGTLHQTSNDIAKLDFLGLSSMDENNKFDSSIKEPAAATGNNNLTAADSLSTKGSILISFALVGVVVAGFLVYRRRDSLDMQYHRHGAGNSNDEEDSSEDGNNDGDTYIKGIDIVEAKNDRTISEPGQMEESNQLWLVPANSNFDQIVDIDSQHDRSCESYVDQPSLRVCDEEVELRYISSTERRKARIEVVKDLAPKYTKASERRRCNIPDTVIL